MRDPGIEPGSVPWQGTILPLNQPRSYVQQTISTLLILLYVPSASHLSLTTLVHDAGIDGGPTQDQVYGARESQLAGRQPAKFVYSQSGGVTCVDQKELCVRSGMLP